MEQLQKHMDYGQRRTEDVAVCTGERLFLPDRARKVAAHSVGYIHISAPERTPNPAMML